MRTQLLCDLENRIKRLRSKKEFCENMANHHIPAFQVFITNLAEAIQEYFNKASQDLEDQIRELDDVVNDLCGLNQK